MLNQQAALEERQPRASGWGISRRPGNSRASRFHRAVPLRAELGLRREEGARRALGSWTKGKKKAIFRLRKHLLAFVPSVFKGTKLFSLCFIKTSSKAYLTNRINFPS